MLYNLVRYIKGSHRRQMGICGFVLSTTVIFILPIHGVPETGQEGGDQKSQSMAYDIHCTYGQNVEIQNV